MREAVQRFLKSAMDRLGAAVLLVLLLPVMCVLALLVRIKMGSPVLFRQRRPGKDEKIFELVKFRTMKDAHDAQGQTVAGRGAAHFAGKVDAIVKPGRAAAVVERPARGVELCGAASFTGAVFAAVHGRTETAAPGKAGDHRLGAGERPQCDQLGREIRAGYLVRGPLEFGPRREDYVFNRGESVAAAWDIASRAGDDGRV